MDISNIHEQNKIYFLQFGFTGQFNDHKTNRLID